MCLDDRLHESKILVKMTNVILKHLKSPGEEAVASAFFFLLRVSGSLLETRLDSEL